MNLADERLTAPLPESCSKCQHRERWIAAGVERNRCMTGHPMHDGCGWFKQVDVSLISDRTTT